MIGAVAGDIIGSRFEGRSAPPHDFELLHPDCCFTDDTVCTLAIADALLGDGDFARALRNYVRRHPERGYGDLFLEWALTDGAPAYGSWGNGAPMRVAAVGWLAKDENAVMQLAESQAAVSHNHPDAIAAAQAVALGIFLARQGLPSDSIRRRLQEAFGYDLTGTAASSTNQFDVSAKGTVVPALGAALLSTNWENAVRAVISCGGDTDTLGCIAGSMSEAIHGVPPEIATFARRHLSEDLIAVLKRFETAVRS